MGERPEFDLRRALFEGDASRDRILQMAERNPQNFVKQMSDLLRVGNRELTNAVHEIMSTPQGRQAIETVMQDMRTRAMEEMRQMIRENDHKSTPEILSQYSDKILKLMNGAEEYARLFGGNFARLYSDLKHEYDLKIFQIWRKVQDQLKTPMDRFLDLSRKLEYRNEDLRKTKNSIEEMIFNPIPGMTMEWREEMLAGQMRYLASIEKEIKDIEEKMSLLSQQIGPDDEPRFGGGTRGEFRSTQVV